MQPNDLPERLQKVAVNATGCWVWTGSFSPKYPTRPRISLGGKYVWAYRAAYEALVGPIPDGLTIDHLCHNPPCINPAHLDVCTHSENVRRYHAAGLSRGRATRRSGIIVARRSLTDEQVLSIYGDRRSMNILAAEYGVAKSTIGRIRDGQRWSHLTGAVARKAS